jgi:hypothetical protein
MKRKRVSIFEPIILYPKRKIAPVAKPSEINTE